MSITHVTATRNAAANAVVDLADVGTTNPNAQLVYMTAADAVVATLEMSNPAYGAAASAVASAVTIASDTNAAGHANPIAKFKVVNRDGAEVYRGSVTATSGGGDIELSSLTIGAGDTVATSSVQYTAPA